MATFSQRAIRFVSTLQEDSFRFLQKMMPGIPQVVVCFNPPRGFISISTELPKEAIIANIIGFNPPRGFISISTVLYSWPGQETPVMFQPSKRIHFDFYVIATTEPNSRRLFVSTLQEDSFRFLHRDSRFGRICSVQVSTLQEDSFRFLLGTKIDPGQDIPKSFNPPRGFISISTASFLVTVRQVSFSFNPPRGFISISTLPRGSFRSYGYEFQPSKRIHFDFYSIIWQGQVRVHAGFNPPRGFISISTKTLGRSITTIAVRFNPPRGFISISTLTVLMCLLLVAGWFQPSKRIHFDFYRVR